MEIQPVSHCNTAVCNSTAKAQESESRSLHVLATANEPEQRQSDAIEPRENRALGIFRQEVRTSLAARYQAGVAVSADNYAGHSQPDGPDQVAQETLGAARQAVAESPTTASDSLVAIRLRVHQAAEYVQSTVGELDDVNDVRAAVGKVDEGLDELQKEAAMNRESSASVLNVDLAQKQRSVIRIRTQEGDVVRFDLKQVDRLSATDTAKSGEDGSSTTTEVDMSSKTRMMIRVKGDLNESEYAAIQNVFSQAESIANEFFDGDLAAALNLAGGFEFDTDQLARVKMRFRSHQVSNIAYSETVTRPASAPIEESVKPAAPQVALRVPAAPEPAPEPAARPTPEVAEAVTASTPEVAVNSPAVIDDRPLASFFEALSGFLRSVSEGFETGPGGGSFRLHYSESFKLDILKAVIHTVAPEESSVVADNTVHLIDNLAIVGEAKAETS